MSPPESSLLGAEGDALIAAAWESLGSDLRTVVEYDEETYEVLYVSEWLRDYLGEEGVEETTDDLHGYVHLDFVERDLFGRLTPGAGAVRTHITRLENATFVRYLVGDAALFLSVDPDADLTALCAAMDEALAAERT